MKSDLTMTTEETQPQVKKENRFLRLIKDFNRYLVCDIERMQCHLASTDEISEHQANDTYVTQAQGTGDLHILKSSA